MTCNRVADTATSIGPSALVKGLCLLLSLSLFGCVSQATIGPAGPKPPVESAQAPRADSRFAPAEAAIAAQHGPD